MTRRTGRLPDMIRPDPNNSTVNNGMTMTEYFDVAIVGASHAGAHLASTLRDRGFTGSVIMIGEEAMLPYDRPSLSKAYMLGSIGIERILLRDANYWAESNIELALNVTVTQLDSRASTLQLGDGRTIQFGHCVLATGGAVRTLVCPGANLPGIYTVRSIIDVDAIRTALNKEMNVAIIGAGYVGLEAAAVLREMGHRITVIEAQDRVLARVTGAHLSAFVENKHRLHGVDIKLGQQVVAIEGKEQVQSILLASGERVAADIAIVGIGISPRTELAEAAGLDCDGGIIVDEFCRTSFSTILAIGDCARHPNSYAGGLWRLESVQHATGSAEVAADTIMGNSRGYDALPTFWSDQYDLRIQSAGIVRGDADALIRGDINSESFSIFYLQDGAVVALDAVNNPKDFMGGRSLVQARLRVSRNLLTDTSVPIRQIAKQLLN